MTDDRKGYPRQINDAYELLPLDAVKPHPRNPRRGDLDAIKASMDVNGFYGAIVANKRTGYILAGNHRWMAARMLELPEIPVLWVDVGEAEARRILATDNRTGDLGGYDDAVLASLLQGLQDDGGLLGTGYSGDDLDELLSGLIEDEEPSDAGSLRERFGCPPFSILDARSGPWRDRKKAWIAFGVDGGAGRDAPVFNKSQGGDPVSKKIQSTAPTTSIFDPVLSEIIVNWYSPVNGRILDPFAGGSTRGVIASLCGRQYVGVDVRAEQIDANREQWDSLGRGGDYPEPVWIHGDSSELDKIDGVGDRYDLLFSCPPYGDLEVYSDQSDDISTMNHDDFLETYRRIIKQSAAKLDDNRFACFVVGDFRDRKGMMRNFVSDTIAAFLGAGLALYNEAILITAVGNLRLLAGKTFRATRKLGKCHQNVLVFIKGDPKKAALACGDVSLVDIEEG
jgi:hypothetical protein